jgi:hypothetical protein
VVSGLTVGYHHDGARRVHIDAPQPYVDQVNRKGRVVGPPIPPPGRALCGVRLSWLIVAGKVEAVTCPRCWDALWASIKTPSQAEPRGVDRNRATSEAGPLVRGAD